MKVIKLKAYEYPLKDKDGWYKGYYTIKESAKPVGFKGEKFIGSFEIFVK